MLSPPISGLFPAETDVRKVMRDAVMSWVPAELLGPVCHQNRTGDGEGLEGFLG